MLVFADMDGLEAISDGLGHERGDAAIRDFTSLMRGAFRASDIVARLGGDECAGQEMYERKRAKRRVV